MSRRYWPPYPRCKYCIHRKWDADLKKNWCTFNDCWTTCNTEACADFEHRRAAANGQQMTGK